MKKYLLLLAGIFATGAAFAQTSLLYQNFTNVPIGSVPTGWTVSSNTDAMAYQRPFDCVPDVGLQTPAVGKTAPFRMILPALAWSNAEGVLSVRFKVFVLDANTSCRSAKDFPCPTYVNVMMVRDGYAGTISNLPDPANIIAEQTYRIAMANGDNTIIFNDLGAAIANGEQYQLYFDFKTAPSADCNAGGTKFIFDDINIERSICGDHCPPVANNDFFDGTRQSFLNSIRANVYGGFALWSSDVRTGYEMKSLSNAPAVNDGLDYDANNTPVANMQFQLVAGPEVTERYCSANGDPGTFVWNGDGTFSYDRLDRCVKTVQFSYKIIDDTQLESAVATVTISFPAYNPLPVTLTWFRAAHAIDGILLTWQTSAEINSRGFYVERNATGNWEQLGFVPAMNNDGNTLNNYQFKDLISSKAVIKYRLVHVDLDGRYAYSEVRAVGGNDKGKQLLIYPNPSAGNGVTLVVSDMNNLFDVDILDGAGRLMQQWRGLGSNYVKLARLQPGMYVARVCDRSTGVMVSAKFLVIK